MKSNLLICVVIASVSFLPRAFGQGALTPPGPPGPTMLTLSQVEPRIPVDASHTPGNSSGEFVITNSGSYFLTTNIIGISGKDGIDIYTNDVTLDLNGFSLTGVSGSLSEGVQIFPGCTNITVRNGAIRGWSQHGVYSVGNNVTLEGLSVSGNANYGLVVVGVSVIRNCMSSGNYYTGIAIEANGCLVSGNVCAGDDIGGTSGNGGIVILGSYNRIEGNHITGTGAGGDGIVVETYGLCTNNIIIQNSVQGSGANDYVFNTLQLVGPIITNSVSGVITNSNPWANFGF
ncbi:MAG TPA: right-handed parallel beta-helix repeat-containing protein [Candidatus Sulfotelmatobacter sp.]|nr:right-handed parallel beta-helix repeat-containing protein [Candidatus Sulfotelmatobacter sp.]